MEKDQTRRHERRIMASLWLLIFAVSSQVMVVAPILTTISSELSVPVASLGSLMTVYAVAVGGFALIAGPISDRVGRRRVLVWGSVLMTIALALHSISWSYASLLTFRGLAGLGGGVLSGATVAFVGDYFPAERRGWANGWIMTGIATGQILGVPAGTLLAGALGFRALFLILAVLSALAALTVLLFVPNLPTQAGRLTLRSMMRGYGSLLARRTTSVATVAYVAVCFSISSFMYYLPTWLEVDFAFSSHMIAALYLLGGLGGIIAGPKAGRLSDRLGRRSVILWSTAGFVVFVILVTVSAGFVALIVFPTFFAVNVFLAARMSAYQALLTELVGAQERGSLMSLTTAAGQAGFAAGAAISGATFADYGFSANTLLTAVTAILGGALVGWLMPDPKPENEREETGCPCNQLQMQSGLCGPTPENGHMATVLQTESTRQARAA